MVSERQDRDLGTFQLRSARGPKAFETDILSPNQETPKSVFFDLTLTQGQHQQQQHGRNTGGLSTALRTMMLSAAPVEMTCPWLSCPAPLASPASTYAALSCPASSCSASSNPTSPARTYAGSHCPGSAPASSATIQSKNYRSPQPGAIFGEGETGIQVATGTSRAGHTSRVHLSLKTSNAPADPLYPS
jgi:hypothetical protein